MSLIDHEVQCIPLEYPQIIGLLENEDTIILGYPTQFSNAPMMVRDFIKKNSDIRRDKKVFCLNTMGLLGQRLWFYR